MESANKVTGGTIARTIILIIALINQVLTATGHSVIPIDDATVTGLISTIFTVVTAMIAWWKNNSFTSAAIHADKIMHAIKSEEKKNQNGQ